MPKTTPAIPTPIAKTQARVRRMESRLIEAGARRMPGGLLQARAAAAAQALIANGWAPNITQAINQALIQCAANNCDDFPATDDELMQTNAQKMNFSNELISSIKRPPDA